MDLFILEYCSIVRNVVICFCVFIMWVMFGVMRYIRYWLLKYFFFLIVSNEGRYCCFFFFDDSLFINLLDRFILLLFKERFFSFCFKIFVFNNWFSILKLWFWLVEMKFIRFDLERLCDFDVVIMVNMMVVMVYKIYE